MAEDRGGSSGPSIAVIAVVALLVVAGIAIWFTTQQSTQTRESTSTSEYREVPAENPGGATSTGAGTQQGTEPSTDVPDTISIDAR